MSFFSASISFPFHRRIGLTCSSSTLRNSGFCMLQKRARNSICSSSQQKSSSFKRDLLPLCTCTASEETHAWNMVSKSRQMEISHRERQRCFTSKALVNARIDVADSGPSACKLIREGRFHCNVCKRKMKNSCPLHCYMVNWEQNGVLSLTLKKMVRRLSLGCSAWTPFPLSFEIVFAWGQPNLLQLILLATRNLVLILQPWFFQPISGHGA